MTVLDRILVRERPLDIQAAERIVASAYRGSRDLLMTEAGARQLRDAPVKRAVGWGDTRIRESVRAPAE